MHGGDTADRLGHAAVPLHLGALRWRLGSQGLRGVTLNGGTIGCGPALQLACLCRPHSGNNTRVGCITVGSPWPCGCQRRLWACDAPVGSHARYGALSNSSAALHSAHSPHFSTLFFGPRRRRAWATRPTRTPTTESASRSGTSSAPPTDSESITGRQTAYRPIPALPHLVQHLSPSVHVNPSYVSCDHLPGPPLNRSNRHPRARPRPLHLTLHPSTHAGPGLPAT